MDTVGGVACTVDAPSSLLPPPPLDDGDRNADLRGLRYLAAR